MKTGNRRSKEDLELAKIEMNKLAFVLEEQDNFLGTEEQLEKMQEIERAYINGTPIMSDEEWDILKNKHNYRESLVSGSPSGRSWIKMFSPLPSIDKAISLEDALKFLNRFDENEKFKVELKLDGLTANIRYKLNKDKKQYEKEYITSRGNGRYGLAIHEHALSGVDLNFPLTINESDVRNALDLSEEDISPDYFEARGEAVLKKNKRNIEKYGKDATWRSVVSGVFNRKIPNNIKGLLIYYFGTSDVLSLDSSGVLEIKDKSMIKLLIKLSSYNEKLLKGDKVFIDKDLKLNIIKANGEIFSFVDEGEEMDIVFFSISKDNSNIDTDRLSLIPGMKYLSEISFQDDFDSSNYELTYRVTNDRNSIIKAIADFYGCDINGKRDFSKARLRNLYEYAMDGVIIKPVNSNSETQDVSFRPSKNNPSKIICPKYPKDQIAVKLLSEMVKVKLEKIEYKETTLGNITCSGILDKPYMTESGAVVQRINLHNPVWLESNSWIKEGEEYYMVMSLDIIPVLMNPELI